MPIKPVYNATHGGTYPVIYNAPYTGICATTYRAVQYTPYDATADFHRK
jgi:hypothetical protein